MSWPYSFTADLWLPIFTTIFLIGLGWYGWRRRSVPGALYFAVGSLLAAAWVAGSVMELAATDTGTKIFWVKFQAIFMLPAVTMVTCFILEYTWPGRWLSRRNLILLSIVPLLFLVLILTNDLHHLVWRSFINNGSIVPLIGPISWFALVYVYALGLIEILAFAWLFLRSPQHRWPVVILLVGQLGARAIYFLEFAGIVHFSISIDVLVIGYLFLMYAIVLFGFRIFDPIPLARRRAIEQLHAGMLVLDPQGRVASLNPAAESILQAPAGRLKGQSIRELLPLYPDGHLADPGETEIELSLGPKEASRRYTLEISLLKDWRGLATALSASVNYFSRTLGSH